MTKLSINLPADVVEFVDSYASSHGSGSRSGVVRAALRILHASQIADDYEAAWSDQDEEYETWEPVTSDGCRA